MISMGGAGIVGGASALLITSGPERKYEVVKALPEPLLHEEASREALRSLA